MGGWRVVKQGRGSYRQLCKATLARHARHRTNHRAAAARGRTCSSPPRRHVEKLENEELSPGGGIARRPPDGGGGASSLPPPPPLKCGGLYGIPHTNTILCLCVFNKCTDSIPTARPPRRLIQSFRVQHNAQTTLVCAPPRPHGQRARFVSLSHCLSRSCARSSLGHTPRNAYLPNKENYY